MNKYTVVAMSNYTVANDFFPLKELRVRGEIQAWQKIYQDNADSVHKKMLALRNDFGTSQIDVNGNAMLLELWRANGQGYADNSPQQLRWCVHISENKQRIFITVPIVKALSKNNVNSRKLNKVFQQLAPMPHFEKVLDFEQQRVALNANSKATHRILQALTEVQQGRELKQFLQQL